MCAATRRNRIVFDADPDVRDIVEKMARGTRGRYLNQAIRAYERQTDSPSYQFVPAPSKEEASINQLVAEARREIVFVGHTLAGIVSRSKEVLYAAIDRNDTNGLPPLERVTAILIHPKLDGHDPLYKVLERQHHGVAFVDKLVGQCNASVEFFRDLQERGRNNAMTVVQVFGCWEVPSFGLVMVDPESDRPRLRVGFYDGLTPQLVSPFMDVNPETEEGRNLYLVLRRYCGRLKDRSERLDPLSEFGRHRP